MVAHHEVVGRGPARVTHRVHHPHNVFQSTIKAVVRFPEVPHAAAEVQVVLPSFEGPALPLYATLAHKGLPSRVERVEVVVDTVRVIPVEGLREGLVAGLLPGGSGQVDGQLGELLQVAVDLALEPRPVRSRRRGGAGDSACERLCHGDRGEAAEALAFDQERVGRAVLRRGAGRRPHRHSFDPGAHLQHVIAPCRRVEHQGLAFDHRRPIHLG